jgi:hypothetical protein
MSPRAPGFNLRPVYVSFLVDGVGLAQGFLRVLGFRSFGHHSTSELDWFVLLSPTMYGQRRYVTRSDTPS